MTKSKELRNLSKEELKLKLIELRKQLMKDNAQIATGTTPKSPGQVKETKKTIAKILAVISEKNKPQVAIKKEDSTKKVNKNIKEKING